MNKKKVIEDQALVMKEEQREKVRMGSGDLLLKAFSMPVGWIGTKREFS